TPVPVSGMPKLGFEALEVIFTLPLTAPLAAGEKSTVNDVLWPAVNVKGKDEDRPLKLNPVPLAVAAEIVRLDSPVFERVTVLGSLDPTLISPKATDAGLAESLPGVTAVAEA